MAVTARVLIEPLPRPGRAPQRGGSPRRRTSEQRVRRSHVKLARRNVLRVAFIAVPLALVLAYVWLTAELTAQTYRLHDDLARQAQLSMRANDLRQQAARLESLPRLEAAAAKLHMTLPSKVALIAPPASAGPRPVPTALAASIAGVKRLLDVP